MDQQLNLGTLYFHNNFAKKGILFLDVMNNVCLSQGKTKGQYLIITKHNLQAVDTLDWVVTYLTIVNNKGNRRKFTIKQKKTRRTQIY